MQRRKKAAVAPIRESAGRVDRRAEVKHSADMIYSSLGEIVGGLIDQAKNGNSAAAKFLLEFAGVRMEMGETEAPRENAAELLVKMLTQQREACIQEGATRE